MIELQNISRRYEADTAVVYALNGVSLHVEPGELVAITGASGSGKSTLMNILGCLDNPSGGTYQLDGEDVATLNATELSDLRNQKIGFVFQGFNLLSRTTVLENVELPMLCSRRRRHSLRSVRDRAMTLLEKVGVAARAAHYPNQLSGGQQQRVAIARALINEPRLILADEPTGNLDSKTSAEIIRVLRNLNDDGTTVVIVTHDSGIAANCQRQLVVQDGRLIRDERSTPAEPAAASS